MPWHAIVAVTVATVVAAVAAIRPAHAQQPPTADTAPRLRAERLDAPLKLDGRLVGPGADGVPVTLAGGVRTVHAGVGGSTGVMFPHQNRHGGASRIARSRRRPA